MANALGVPVMAHPDTLNQVGVALKGAATEPVNDGESLDLQGMTLVALHTPGHAAGHLALHVPERSLLIAGDLISGLSTILIDPQHGDMDAYLGSLARAAALRCKLLLPGHGPPLPGKRLEQLIEHRTERERRIVAALGERPLPLGPIAAAAYVDTPEGLPRPLIERQTLAHLRRLERHARARQTGREWRLAQPTSARIEAICRERFAPVHFELRDDSAKHVGHAGATSGGGHFDLLIVAAEFEGQTRLDQHRLVNDCLRDLFGEAIHALALRTLAPAEWTDREE